MEQACICGSINFKSHVKLIEFIFDSIINDIKLNLRGSSVRSWVCSLMVTSSSSFRAIGDSIGFERNFGRFISKRTLCESRRLQRES